MNYTVVSVGLSAAELRRAQEEILDASIRRARKDICDIEDKRVLGVMWNMIIAELKKTWAKLTKKQLIETLVASKSAEDNLRTQLRDEQRLARAAREEAQKYYRDIAELTEKLARERAIVDKLTGYR